MSVRSQLGAVRARILCALYRRCIPLRDSGPIVSFTFDDFPRSSYTIGGAILEEFDSRGTYYATVGLMNRSNELGELFVCDDVHSLLDRGHELASQTFGHSSSRAVSLAEFRNDVQKGRSAVEEMTPWSTANFAYPYGHVTLHAKRTLGPGLASSRGIFPGLNGPEIDLNLLRANRLYGGIEHSPRVEELIHQAVEQRSWLIFYTHDVRPNPSEYGCTPELLKFAVASAHRSGGRILTVQQVLSELGASNGNRPEGHAHRRRRSEFADALPILG